MASKQLCLSLTYLIVLLLDVLFHLGILLRWSLPKDNTTYPHLITPQPHRALKILTHAYAQLQRMHVKPKLPGNTISRVPETNKILILRLSRRSFRTRNRADGHQASETKMGTRISDIATQLRRLIGVHARLGLLAGRVDLHMHSQSRILLVSFELLRRKHLTSALIQRVGLLPRIDARHEEEVRDVRQRTAFVGLQRPDEMPSDGAWEQRRFLRELL